MKTIELKFNQTITTLAGNDFGVDTYKAQVKQEVDFKEKVVIIIPQHIERLAISFVQGFTEDIFKHIRKDEFEDYFEIQGRSKVVKKFKEGIYF